MLNQAYEISRRHGQGVSQFIEKHTEKGIRFIQSFEKGVQIHPKAKEGIRACCQDPEFQVALVNDSSYMIINGSLEEEIKHFESFKKQAPDRLCIIKEKKCFLYDLSVIT
jgi:hypothetical protein